MSSGWAPFVTLLVCAPLDRPIVAEVLYDAAGDDTGLEFVELLNPTAAAASLGGLRLEAADGSAPGRWTLRWTGAPGDAIAPGGRFVVGGARVTPAPQAVVSLELQNGPDAVRLVWPDGAVEVVGYGTHEFAEYLCGSPAPDVASGLALARVPDEANLGSNAADFRGAPPSPGAANQPPRNAALLRGSLAIAPDPPEPGVAARLAGTVANHGREPFGPEGAFLAATRGDIAVIGRAMGAGLAPGDSLPFDEPIAGLPEGEHRIAVRVSLAGDGAGADDADTLRLRVGPGPLELTEIQFHPADGEGEWVEVRNRSTGALALTGLTLSDRGAGRGRPSAGDGALAPESLAVLVQSRAAFLARHADCAPARVWQVAPWSSLNNTDDSTGVADWVVLRDSTGLVVDRVAFSAAGVPAGVPLERRDGGWWPAAVPEGTPLAPPRVPPPAAGRFELSPRRLAAGVTVGRVAWALPWARARIAVEVYDLAGRRALRAIPETAVPPRGERTWPARDLAPGVYLVVLRARAETGGESLVESRALRVDGVAP